MSRRHAHRNRRGTVLVFSAFAMVIVLAMLACAIDVGYLCVARNELQRSADAAALAAAWELIDEGTLTGNTNVALLESNARSSATEFAASNTVLRQSPSLATTDIAVGYLVDPTDPTVVMDLSGANHPNAVTVRVCRTAERNGKVPFFIANILGISDANAEAQATAALLTSVHGFRAPSDGGNLDLLPFALDVNTWTDMLNGIGSDDWKWNAALQQVQSGADGILEVNLFPQGTGSPGNRGTVDIGSSNNSTADIARQIVSGISPADFAYHGGSLELDVNDELGLNGDTGISAGVKDELASIIGQPRLVPIFNAVVGPGNNAQYTIVQFAGIRITEVKLTGKQTSKRVMVQPANVITLGGIPGPSQTTSQFVYSPAWLAR